MRLLPLLIACLFLGFGCSSSKDKAFVGQYSMPQLQAHSKECDLSLLENGEYTLITQFPEDLGGPNYGDDVRPSFEEVGTWRYEGSHITLRTKNGEKLKRLQVVTKEGRLCLFSDDVLAYSFEKKPFSDQGPL